MSDKSPEKALRYGTIGATLIFIVAALLVTVMSGVSLSVWTCVVAGAVGGMVIGLVTEFYTGGAPVRRLAADGETGPATIMISGLALGMESVVVPVLTPGMGEETRKITDGLDEVGNTTAAIGKGFAIGAAGLAALAIIAAFIQTIKLKNPDFSLDIGNPLVLVGMFIGGIFPFLVSAITMRAVGAAAFDMIKEIRRQFREIPGLLEGTGKPDNARCVKIATTAALRRMILPGVLAVGAPPLIGFGLGAEALGGFLAGALVGCVMLALMMANAGGAWDNAKKYVEKGNLGGKGTETHAAAVVGDTVGDPFKDTSGPAMNILINVMAIVSLVIAPLLA